MASEAPIAKRRRWFQPSHVQDKAPGKFGRVVDIVHVQPYDQEWTWSFHRNSSDWGLATNSTSRSKTLRSPILWSGSISVYRLNPPPPQPIETVRWPVKLNRLMFTSAHFNQPVEDSDWPSGLTHLCFRSDAFNQPIEGDSWPRGLNVPHLGEVIEQDVKNASWSPKVARICFGDRLNKPVEGGHSI